MATSAAALMVKAHRDVTDHFMSSNAVSHESAVCFVPIRRSQLRMFERMVKSGVLVAASKDRWFIDIPRYRAATNTRRKRMIGVFGTLIVAVAGVAFLG